VVACRRTSSAPEHRPVRALSTTAAAIETADIVGLKTSIIASLKTGQLAALTTDQLSNLTTARSPR
jgi:hypothetical protein